MLFECRFLKRTCVSIGLYCRSGLKAEIDGERGPSFQPRLHANLLDSPARVSEPSRELREIHAAIVSQILLFCLRRIGVTLVLFNPLH